MGCAVGLRKGGHTQARVEWVRSQMPHLKKQDFDAVVKRWRLREMVRVEIFLRLVALGGGQWSATRSWIAHG